ncbi:MAG: F0F1 ATP synthase subunit A [Rhodospirillaceae bacterium]
MNPLHQFNIVQIIPIDISGGNVSFTNSALFMLIAAGCALGVLLGGMRHRSLIPGRLQTLAEVSYEFVSNIVYSNTGPDGRPFVPFVLSLFLFILLGNLIGMVPYTFTFTSHIAVTAALAMVVFLMVTVLGLVRHGLHFFTKFVPKGVPIALMPLMIPLEIISYFIRPVSLSVRLFANIMAGHTMLKVFGGFIVMMASALGFIGYVIGLLPLALVIVMIGFEFFVAFIQAYVFALLTVIYIQDALELH